MSENNSKRSGLATASMVLGIIAVAGAWIPFLNIVSIILGILAVALGIAPLIKKRGLGKAITGVVLGVITIIIFTAMYSGGDTTNQSSQQTATDNSSEQVSAETSDENERLTLDEGWTIDNSNPYVTQVKGTVSNNSDRAIEGYIQITFSALDADGANVGDCLANANTVDANGTWRFEAMCSGDNIETVRFKSITGF